MKYSTPHYQAVSGGFQKYSPLERIATQYHISPAESSESSGNVAYSISSPSTLFSQVISYFGKVYSNFSNFFAQSMVSPSYSSSPAALQARYEQSTKAYRISQPRPEYHFSPDDFLKPGKGRKFVGKAEEIQEFVEQAFEKICHTPFPENIKLSVLNEKDFRLLAPHPGTIGLSINRGKYGLLSEIFILNDTLGRVMLTVGHELGHALTETLNDGQDEEAKAYAFSLEWMRVIKEQNIAGLRNAIITENPAQNGLHNIAFAFVQEMLQRGRRAWEVYTDLVKGALSLKVRVDCL